LGTLYLFAYLFVLLLTILFPIYILGRLWFAISPFFINYFTSEKRNWYNDWNNDRFIIVFSLCIASFLLSSFWGLSLLEEIKQSNLQLTSIFFYIILQVICLILFEVKMDHPFKPYSAYKIFQKKKYNERFVFSEASDEAGVLQTEELKREIRDSKGIILEELQQHKEVAGEIHHFTKESNELLKKSDFIFDIKNNSNLILADVMSNYFISKDSESILEDFLLRKRKSGKITFTKTARNGVSVQPILDFFSIYTNLMEKCKEKENGEISISQVEAVKIINELVVAKDKHGNPVENPINAQNFSKYVS